MSQGPGGPPVDPEDLLLHGQDQLFLFHEVPGPQLVALLLLGKEQLPELPVQGGRGRDPRDGLHPWVLADVAGKMVGLLVQQVVFVSLDKMSGIKK